MLVNLLRTFSQVNNQVDSDNEWDRYIGRSVGKLTWKDLHDKPITVVLGEAGIGKTTELQSERQRLSESGKAAFFIELNQLTDYDSWELSLGQSALSFNEWLTSARDGYFFLDAVDEARLNSHAAFKKALLVVNKVLSKHLERVHIVISSRITDWSIDEVRTTVDSLLVRPIQVSNRAQINLPECELGEVAQIDQLSNNEEHIEAFVTSLNQLSRLEAHKFTVALDTVDVSAFWEAVDDGQYDFMTTRPLDLKWMITLWNQKNNLGTYSELMEGNISNQLTETNPSYQAAGSILSPEQLRHGSEELAAASEFSGHAFVTTVPAALPRSNEVAPQTVLTGWSSTEIFRLLSSAVFDEATFGRVKFNTRIVREYLAACWVNRQLVNGLPLHRVLTLFAATPYNELVIVPARRWTLCWLAVLNVKVREWVVQYFPELVLFDGDPEAWDTLSLDQAFEGYVQRLKEGLRTDWYNNASEFRRLGKCLSSHKVSMYLNDPQLSEQVKSQLLPIVKHASLTDCADVIFATYKKPDTSQRERVYQLEVLKNIATTEQRIVIKDDLLSGFLISNRLIASALSVIDWKSLSIDELIKVLTTASTEDANGMGAMARCLKEDLLPNNNADSATLLLKAVMASLPQPKQGEVFSRYSNSNQPDHAWLLDVLSDCIESLLELLPIDLVEYPAVCYLACERLEELRDSGFTDHDEFLRLHTLIAKHLNFRWQLGLTIAKSDDILHATNRLIWGRNGLINFTEVDIPQLIVRANDLGSDPAERTIWFTITRRIALKRLRGAERSSVFTQLQFGPDKAVREKDIAEQITQEIAGVQQTRVWSKEDRQRKHKKIDQHESNIVKLHEGIQHIRDGSQQGTLGWLVNYSRNNSDDGNLTSVDYKVITKDFGHDISEALSAGLKMVWENSKILNPSDSSDGTWPWEPLLSLAGLHTLIADGLDVKTLQEKCVVRAAQLAVWEFDGPPSWFESLTISHSEVVSNSLHPWIINEVLFGNEINNKIHGALSMALRCPTPVRSILLHPLIAFVKDNQIASFEILRSIIDALCEDSLIKSDIIEHLCRTKLVTSVETKGLIEEVYWLHLWLEVDIEKAWSWFEEYIAKLNSTANEQVKIFAKGMDNFNWNKAMENEENINCFIRMHGLLSKYLPAQNDNDYGNPIRTLRETIPGVLTKIPGITAHSALNELAKKEKTLYENSGWINERVREHSTNAATQSTQIEPSALVMISSPFLSKPKNESQLFEQVEARLEEIQIGVEQGPFSDRSLFTKETPEKKLQLWLAARFHDTQNRIFGIHREEEVDADKRTDVQLSYLNWNVCVEIKPVDADRGYSAASLTETLRKQIVRQYLKGYNSSHGILVLFRLDEKTWDIPGGKRRQPFSALVTYLKKQADQIVSESPGVNELIVISIDCIKPKIL